MRSAARGVGNLIVLLGARTGRDGIGGASVLASAELGRGRRGQAPERADRGPARGEQADRVLPGAVERDLIVSLQDLGAAGLSSSTSEMASKGGVGLDLDVAKVPLREPGMEPFEIMISESQERMLCVVEPARLEALLAVCRALGDERDADRRGHGQRPPARVRRRRAGRRHAGHGARRRVPALRPRARRARGSAGMRTRAPPPLLGRRGRRRPTPSRAARLAERREPALGVRAVRLLVGSRTVRRPEQADAAVLRLAHDGPRHGPCARRLDRRQRPARRLRSLRRRGRGRLRVRREPRLRRRRAARAHELPELREPGEAAHRLAADAGGRGHGRRLPRASPYLSWEGTCRSTTRGRRGRSTRRRSSAWWASCRIRPALHRAAFSRAPRGDRRRPGRAGRAVPALARRARSSRSSAASSRRRCRAFDLRPVVEAFALRPRGGPRG